MKNFLFITLLPLTVWSMNHKRSAEQPQHIKRQRTFETSVTLSFEELEASDATDIVTTVSKNCNWAFVTGPNRETLVHLAIKKNSLKLVDWALQFRSIISRDRAGQTPMHYAAYFNRSEMIKRLYEIHQVQTKISCQADIAGAMVRAAELDIINSIDTASATPLHLATSSKSHAAMSTLINRGAYVNAIDSRGNTALHIAAELGDTEGIKILRKGGAMLSMLNKQNLSPLGIAAFNNQKDAFDLLMSLGADLNQVDSQGNTLLHTACKLNKKEAVALIAPYKDKITINSLNKLGYSPLLIAAYYNHIEIIQLLLNMNININQTGINNISALHIATIKNNVETVKILLEAGADVHQMNRDNVSSLDIAIKKNHPTIISILVAHALKQSLTAHAESSKTAQ